MPKTRIEALSGSGDYTWLASDHSLFNSRTETLDAAKFAAVQTEKGKVPSGYPVTLTDGKVVPYKSGDVLAGHILTDQDAAHGDIAVPVLDHGRVKVSHVPQDGFAAPDAQTKTTIVYL